MVGNSFGIGVRIALLVLCAVALVACTPAGGSPSGTGKPAATELRAQASATPSELEVLLPGLVNGHVLRPSVGAARVVRAQMAAALDQVLTAVEATVSDVEVASADNSTEGGSHVSVTVIRVRGVPADRFLATYLDLVVGPDRSQHISPRSMNGRDVWCVYRSGDPIWSCWLARDDVLFVSSSDEFLLIREAILAVS